MAKARKKLLAASGLVADIDPDDAFYLRGDLLRGQFGHWDSLDSVAAAILDLVEAQNELADAFADHAERGINCIKEAVAKRHRVGEKLMRTLNDRSTWPDPDLEKGGRQGN